MFNYYFDWPYAFNYYYRKLIGKSCSTGYVSIRTPFAFLNDTLSKKFSGGVDSLAIFILLRLAEYSLLTMMLIYYRYHLVLSGPRWLRYSYMEQYRLGNSWFYPFMAANKVLIYFSCYCYILLTFSSRFLNYRCLIYQNSSSVY